MKQEIQSHLRSVSKCASGMCSDEWPNGRREKVVSNHRGCILIEFTLQNGYRTRHRSKFLAPGARASPDRWCVARATDVRRARPLEAAGRMACFVRHRVTMMRQLVPGLLVFALPVRGCAFAAGAGISVPTPDGPVMASLFSASGERPRPAVLILHGRAGFDPYAAYAR